ncbi:hypothetical protein FCV25MIE_16609 [Fagus crenata]
MIPIRFTKSNEDRVPFANVINVNGTPSITKKKSQGMWRKKTQESGNNRDQAPLPSREKQGYKENEDLSEEWNRQGKVACFYQEDLLSAEAVVQPRRGQ